MARPRSLRFILLCVFVLASVGVTYRAGASSAAAIGGERATQPVLVTGSSIGTLVGAPVAELYVYAYKSGAWQPIPYQVDEVNDQGLLVASDDGVLDANDQVAFMAQDLGDAAGSNWPDQTGAVVGTSWQQIEVTDPLDTNAKGYAYIVRQSGTPTRSNTSYVSFDQGNRRIIGQTYQMGFSQSVPSGKTEEQPNIWFDYLTIGSGQDILDRTPKFEGCSLGSCLKEAFLFSNTPPEDGLSVVKQGPVRLLFQAKGGTLVTTTIAAYGTLMSWKIDLFSPTLPLSTVRVSNDFTPNVTGATFYNAATNGVTIDGNADNVPTTPYSPWLQVSTSSGSLIQASDVSNIGGTPENYYVDKGTACTFPIPGCDTGDLRRFGDSGVLVREPESTFTYRYNQYFVTGQQSNIGARYGNYFAQPLAIRVTTTLKPVAYLPLIRK